jgi:anti-anti-sigma factor
VRILRVVPDVSPEVLGLSGEFDLARKHELRTMFSTCGTSAPLTIDFTLVTYIDSTFLNELASLRSRNTARRITLSGVSKQILRLLEMVNMDVLFIVSD